MRIGIGMRVVVLAVVGWLVVGAAIYLIAENEAETSNREDFLPGSSAPLRCPSLRAVDPQLGAGPLPRGATAALLCNPRGNHSWLPPRDRLTTGLDHLVTLVDRAPVAPSPTTACQSSMSFSTYVLAVQYPSGVRTVGGDTDHCDSLVIGDTHHSGAYGVWRRYLHLLAAQRAHTGWARATTVPRCTTESLQRLSPLVSLRTLLTARLCPTDARERPIGPGVVVPPRLLAAVVHDLRHPPRWRGRSYNACEPRAQRAKTRLYLVATDAWHDRVAFRVVCGTVWRIALNPVLGTQLRRTTARALAALVTR